MVCPRLCFFISDTILRTRGCARISYTPLIRSTKTHIIQAEIFLISAYENSTSHSQESKRRLADMDG